MRGGASEVSMRTQINWTGCGIAALGLLVAGAGGLVWLGNAMAMEGGSEGIGILGILGAVAGVALAAVGGAVAGLGKSGRGPGPD
jgi:hypothetical protein